MRRERKEATQRVERDGRRVTTRIPGRTEELRGGSGRNSCLSA